jgi:hypothetical protein
MQHFPRDSFDVVHLGVIASHLVNQDIPVVYVILPVLVQWEHLQL